MDAMDYADINTNDRICFFLAQTAHESSYFKALIENLNYSKEGLLKTFPKYFTSSTASSYARKPEKIANRVYANRMGNGPESSGDGWKFRGKGLIQLTGKNNHVGFAKDMNMSLDEAVAYLQTKEGAAMGAAWFWEVNNLNRFCDKVDMAGLTKAINGGSNGLSDRVKIFNLAKKVLR